MEPLERSVSLEDFDTSFTGIVLVFEPGPDFRRGGRKPGILGAMPARLRGTTGTMPAAVLASLLLVAVGAAVPALSRTYIDTFLIGGQTSQGVKSSSTTMPPSSTRSSGTSPPRSAGRG